MTIVTSMFAVIGNNCREPRYKGKGLTAWLHNLHERHAKATQDEAAHAIQVIGTNALPILLEYVRNGSKPKAHLKTAMVEKFPILNDWCDSSLDRAQMAVQGFAALGDQARPALPELVKMLDDPDAAIFAAWAMGGIGEASLPHIIAGLQRGSVEARSGCAGALRCFNLNRVDVKVALAAALNDTDSRVRLWAVVSINRAAPHVEIAELAKLVDDPQEFVRREVAKALGLQDSPRNRVALLRLAQDGDADVRSEALAALASFTNRTEKSPD